MVEAQHKVSTRQLVDTLQEQALLEQIVDEVKPRVPPGPVFDGLHYLLSTPFRYPPLQHGSRFGSAAERGLWYGADAVETSLAEKCYYQLLFVEGTKADLKNLVCDWTAFYADVATQTGIDLTLPPFSGSEGDISSPSSYAASQRLGASMRAAGIAAFRYRSARCPRGGSAIGLFEPAFASRNPGPFHTWKCMVTSDGCEVVPMSGAPGVIVFNRSIFAHDGILPAPGVGR